MNLYLKEQEPMTIDWSLYNQRMQQQVALLLAQEDSHLIYHGSHPETVLSYLQRSVASDPVSLRTHIRRIYLAIQCRAKEQLVGALVDLMLVLQGRGQQLLERVLGQSEPLLGDELLAQMREVCTEQASKISARLVSPQSVLS